jgi:hypothetical protein
MPNSALPLTLPGAYQRYSAGVPTSLNSFDSLSGTLRGSGNSARLVRQRAVPEAGAASFVITSAAHA